MKYKTFLEVAEALFDGRMTFLTASELSLGQYAAVYVDYGWEGNMLGAEHHRMWFCLFLHEVTK